MELSIEKYTMLIMKSGKRHLTKGVELQNQVITSLEQKETYKNLGY